MIDDGTSDLQLPQNEPKTSKSVQAEVTITQLPPSYTSPPAPFTPSPKSSGKRKRLKPSRYEFPSNNAEKKRSPSKPKAVRDPSKTCFKSDTNPTMVRAGELQSSLGTDHPSFIKIMLRSHVATCFWMGLPVPFCRSFLPKHDIVMVIEDEKGQQYNHKYIAHKTGLSAGWRKFAIVHKLLEGDVLVFQLVEPCKLKVYIVRANDSKQVDGANDLLNDNAHTKVKARVKMIYKRSKPESLTSKLTRVNSEPRGGSPNPNISLQELKTFKDFRIMVNNQCIDSELSDEIRVNYYKLCTAKKELLHDNLPEGLYYKLVVGMIGETVNISKAIKNCKPNTTKEEFETWDSSLRSFELMGMKVGFLRDRIRVLEKLAFESKDAEKYAKANEERSQNETTIKILEAKILGLKESNRKIDAILRSLEEKAERYEVVFHDKVNEPW